MKGKTSVDSDVINFLLHSTQEPTDKNNDQPNDYLLNQTNIQTIFKVNYKFLIEILSNPQMIVHNFIFLIKVIIMTHYDSLNLSFDHKISL